MVRTFIIATTSAATLFSSAAFTQDPSRGTASIPDFSGLWTKPYIGIELPLSGPSPVVNKSRMRQRLDIDGRPLPAAGTPLVSSVLQLVGDYSNPILKAEAAEVVKKNGEMELRGTPVASARNQCWPEGVPYVFRDLGILLLQQPDKITIVYDYDHHVRRVRLNQPHPAQVTPSWYGDSVGHYEADTLVIDTVGIKIGPFSMVDPFGTPHSQALHVVERYRLIDYEVAMQAQENGLKEWLHLDGGDSGVVLDRDFRGKGLQLEFTVEDEGAFTMPWSAIVTYRRALGSVIPENVCAENLRATYVAKDSAVPRADKPDF